MRASRHHDTVKILNARKCVRTHDTPLPLYTPAHILDDPPPFSQLRTYLMDDLFLNEKTNNNIRISYLLKYKHLKKIIILCKKINGSVG